MQGLEFSPEHHQKKQKGFISKRQRENLGSFAIQTPYPPYKSRIAVYTPYKKNKNWALYKHRSGV